MNYYWFNRQKILQKAKEQSSKKKAAEYYIQNKEAIKRNKKPYFIIFKRLSLKQIMPFFGKVGVELK